MRFDVTSNGLQVVDNARGRFRVGQDDGLDLLLGIGFKRSPEGFGICLLYTSPSPRD